MAKRKTIDDYFQGFVDGLYADGTIIRWEAEKRMKEQERRLNKLDREYRVQRAIDETLKELKGKKSA